MTKGTKKNHDIVKNELTSLGNKTIARMNAIDSAVKTSCQKLEETNKLIAETLRSQQFISEKYG